MTTKRSWSDLSPKTRRLLVAAGAVQGGLLMAAQVDLTRRPQEDIAGSKTLWRLLTLVNFVGPIAYFVLGRKDRALP